MPVKRRVVKPEREHFELDRLIAENYPDVEDTTCVEIRIPNSIEYLYALQGLYAQMTNTWAWSGTLAERKARAAISEKAYVETDWGQCMNCEELTECLQPLFDEINTKLNALQASQTAIETVVEAIQETQVVNAAVAPEPQTTAVTNEICGGATGVVESMNQRNEQEYAAAEAGAVDNIFETINIIVDNIPILGELPFTALYDLANAYFENQATAYTADFLTIKSDIINDLACFVEANGGTFDYNVWGDWLEYIGTTYPTNAAAILFSRYAPARQTFINQIAALINADASLQAYFDELNVAYYAGTQVPVACATACTWCVEYDFSTGNAHGWTIYANGGIGNQATLTATGYVFAAPNDSRITVWKDFGFQSRVTAATIFLTADVICGDLNHITINPLNASNIFVTPVATQPALVETNLTFDEAMDKIGVDVVGSTLHDGCEITATLFKVRLSGTGITPPDGIPC